MATLDSPIRRKYHVIPFALYPSEIQVFTGGKNLNGPYRHTFQLSVSLRNHSLKHNEITTTSYEYFETSSGKKSEAVPYKVEKEIMKWKE